MITGTHAIIWSDDADATRAFFGEVLGFDSVDAGGGWRIFALPPAELGIHPTEESAEVPADDAGGAESSGLRHEVYLMCDDLDTTLAELGAKGVEVVNPPADQGWGVVASIAVPGAGELALYEPRHASPFDA